MFPRVFGFQVSDSGMDTVLKCYNTHLTGSCSFCSYNFITLFKSNLLILSPTWTKRQVSPSSLLNRISSQAFFNQFVLIKKARSFVLSNKYSGWAVRSIYWVLFKYYCHQVPMEIRLGLELRRLLRSTQAERRLSLSFRLFRSESLCVFVLEHVLVFPWGN